MLGLATGTVVFGSVICLLYLRIVRLFFGLGDFDGNYAKTIGERCRIVNRRSYMLIFDYNINYK